MVLSEVLLLSLALVLSVWQAGRCFAATKCHKSLPRHVSPIEWRVRDRKSMGSHGLLHQSKYLELDGREKEVAGRICMMERRKNGSMF